MPARRALILRILLFGLIVASLYALVRMRRSELVDFAVPYRAAERFLSAQPLYRPEDGHYQYKYWPAFALVMTPLTALPKELAEFTWFAVTVAMAWALLHLSITRLPDRRVPERTLFWLTLFVNGKAVVKELAFGQFNLPVGLCLVGAMIAGQQGKAVVAGGLVAAGVFVKPYALLLVPWLAWRLGTRAVVAFGIALVIGLALPAAFYGWSGNLTLLLEWYRTVADTTAPNLMGADNMSFVSMWAKWIGPGSAAASLGVLSIIVAVVAGLIVMVRSRVTQPHYLEVAYFLTLIPLISPQGWDYVLVMAMPAYALLIDRWRDVSPPWRIATTLGIVMTSFVIFDLLRRTAYMALMQVGVVSVGAVVIAICLVHVRSRSIA